MKAFIYFGILIIAVFATIFAAPYAFAAIEGGIQGGINAAHGTGQPTELFGDSGVITSVTNILLFAAGAIAVIMVIWGGLRYVISGGSSSAVTAAKNTIMYALIGLVIAFLAFAIVNFVLSAIAPGSMSGTNV